MLTLLSEPNVLLLDEPTNDVDTDTLAAMEDLLDSWPGTLIVVSHDRYLLERVTDQQYAVLDGRLRHLPGGVGEYLRLAAQRPRPTAGWRGWPNKSRTSTRSSPGTTSPITSASPGSPGSCARWRTRSPRPRAAGWNCRSCSNETRALPAR